MMTVPLIWCTDVADARGHCGDLRNMDSPEVREGIVDRPISVEADNGPQAGDCWNHASNNRRRIRRIHRPGYVTR
jgi:hypothetical protein